MLNQTFSLTNFEEIYDEDNRKGKNQDDTFFPLVVSSSKRLSAKARALRAFKKRYGYFKKYPKHVQRQYDVLFRNVKKQRKDRECKITTALTDIAQKTNCKSFRIAKGNNMATTSFQARISKAIINRLQPGDTVWDTELKGFGARRQKTSASYFMKTRVDGRQKWFTIGKHGQPWRLSRRLSIAPLKKQSIGGKISARALRRLKTVVKCQKTFSVAKHGVMTILLTQFLIVMADLCILMNWNEKDSSDIIYSGIF